MSSKRIIAVFGATGTTGGSVAKYLLEDGKFAVRAITRNASSDKAKALAAAGAEVVVADLSKPETLPAALSGTWGVAGLTDFWAIFQTNNLDPVATQAEEERQGRSLVDAAKAACVKHFVWFSLWDGNVPHWVGKYNIGEYLKASGLSWTIIINAFYFENLSGFGMIKTEGGKNIVSIPQPADTYIPSYSAEQSGGWVLAAFKNPGIWIGRDMKAISDHLTPRQYVSILNEVTGKKFELKEISDAEFAAGATSNNPYERELYLNMKAFVDTCQPPNSIYGSEEDSKKIYPAQYDFRAFCQNNEAFKAFVAKLP